MKYPTKVDRWLTVVMAISALVTVSIPICIILSPGISILQVWGTVLFAICIIGFVAAVSLPTYYEVQSDRLIIRSGLLRWSIQLDEIVSVTPVSNPLSGPAWSLDRLAVRSRHAGKVRTMLISPKQRHEFLQELQARASGLVREGDALRRV
jgi:hypothetical protein